MTKRGAKGRIASALGSCVAGLATACGGTVRIEVPDSVAWVATFAPGGTKAGSRLHEVESTPLELELDESSGPVVVLGYSRQALTRISYSPSSADVIRAQSGCERALPVAEFAWRSDVRRTTDPADAPILTTDSLANDVICSQMMAAEVFCGDAPSPCVGFLSGAPGTCARSVSQCETFERITFHLDDRAPPCVDGLPSECTRLPAQPGSIECEVRNAACHLVLSPVPNELPFVVDPPVPVIAPVLRSWAEDRSFNKLLQGPALDFAIAGDTLVVAATDGFHSFSTADGAPIATATRTLGRLMLDAVPDGSAVLAVSISQRVLRFERMLADLSSRSVSRADLREAIDPELVYEIEELLVLEERAIAVVRSFIEPCELDRSLCVATHLLELDLGTGVIRRFSSMEFTRLLSLVRVDESRWTGLDDERDSIVSIDALSGDVLGSTNVGGSLHLISLNLGLLFRHEPTELYVVPVLDPVITVHTVRERTAVGRALFYERGAPVTVLGPWPADPRFAIAAASDGTNAWVALMDVAEQRFAPGSARLGLGGVRRIRAHGDDVWFLLAWAGELVRVRPAR
ncbi:MAG: hypothetical protein HYV07_21715 [Deltaproteobacteria bacterium]|nr:hypothetical protein [Deltaproteobacteria bacterium]